jgi:hypothetical protein
MKRITFGTLVLVCSATMALAQGTKSPMGTMTPEQRQQMASVHEKVAACLRSDRPVSDCQAEMMKGCQAAMGAGMCPMMGGMMGQMQHGQMMPPPTQAK